MRKIAYLMPLIEIILIGIALSLDAFAVSLCFAVASDSLKLKNMLVIAGFFGFFQALMPYLGWQISVVAQSYIESFDHWIAFALLVYIGVNMILESLKTKEGEVEKRIYSDPAKVGVLFTLAIATSIDAFAVGVSLGCLNNEIVKPAILIGIITFLISLFGAALGGKIAKYVGSKAELFGGVILIGIGVKILIEHIFF